MKPNNNIKEYIRVLSCVNIDDETKHHIAQNCARRSTLQKIRSGKFKIVAVKKENTVEKI